MTASTADQRRHAYIPRNQKLGLTGSFSNAVLMYPVSSLRGEKEKVGVVVAMDSHQHSEVARRLFQFLTCSKYNYGFVKPTRLLRRSQH